MFVAPRVGWHGRRQRVSVDGDPLAGYRTRRALLGADFAVAFGATSELRAGYEAATIDARFRSGAPLLRDIDGVERGARVRWVYDGHDHWLVPRSGTRLETEARWLAAAPEQPSGFAQARFTTSAFLPLGREGRVFLSLVGSTASDDQLPPFHQSTLGGPFRLGAFDRGPVPGGADRLCRSRLPSPARANAGPDWRARSSQAPGSNPAGSTLAGYSPKASPADIRANVSAGLLVDTLVGALFASASIADGKPRFHIALGRPFR